MLQEILSKTTNIKLFGFYIVRILLFGFLDFATERLPSYIFGVTSFLKYLFLRFLVFATQQILAHVLATIFAQDLVSVFLVILVLFRKKM